MHIVSNLPPDPAQVILDLHELGKQLGYSRTRVDRSSLVVDARRVWFEVGYSHKQIHLRSSWAKFTLSYPADKVRWDEVRAQLEMGAASARQEAK
jgi:hypothetical protein